MAGHWGTSRTEAFSDGVFAIAITLLVLDIRVPPESFDDLWHGVLHEWPAYLAYATSFLTIGGIWLAHHGIFSRLRYVDRTVMQLNLLLLMATSFLPYPTRLAAEAVRDTDAERAAVVFYGLSLMAVSVLVGAIWAHVARTRELLVPGVSDDEVRAVLLATTPNIGFYVGATALALVAPHVAAFVYLAIAAILVVRARGDVMAPERPAAT